MLEDQKAKLEKLFSECFEQVDRDKLNREERLSYDQDLKQCRDYYNTIETVERKARAERDKEIARNAIAQGLSIDVIQKLTGLSEEEIKNL